MDFLNRAFAQISDLFRSMTPGARMTAGLLLVVIVVSLGYLFTAQVGGHDGFLLGGQEFTIEEITTMSGAFGQANLNDFQIEGNRVRIPRAQQAAYLKALFDNNALPTNYAQYMLNTVTGTSVWANQSMQKQVSDIAHSTGVSKLLSELPFVASVEVVHSAEQKGGLRRDRVQSALVKVKAKGNVPLDKDQIRSFRLAVANAYAGMPYENVAVVDGYTGQTYGGAGGDALADALEDGYFNRKLEYEAAFRRAIESALGTIAGLSVSCNVELTKETHRETNEIVVDPKTVAMKTLDQSSESTTEGPGPGGRPGLPAQGAVPNGGAQLSASGGPKSSETSSVTETNNVASHEQTRSTIAPMTPSRVTAAISIPKSYFEHLWRSANPTPDGEEPKPIDAAAVAQIETTKKAEIRAHVASLLPPPADLSIDPTTLVSIMTVEPTPVTGLDEPSMATSALSWFAQNWSTLGMIGVGMFSLVMLRSMIRSGPALPDTFLAPIEVPQEDEETAAADKKAKQKRRFASTPSSRGDLVEMVREDPDAAANILSGWIGNTTG